MDAVWGGIITALISGICVAVPTIVATVTSNKAHDQVVDERVKYITEQVKEVEVKIDRYASNVDELKERLIIVEQKVTAEHSRLDDIAGQLNIKEHRKDR